jgi:hypothetical protein
VPIAAPSLAIGTDAAVPDTPQRRRCGIDAVANPAGENLQTTTQQNRETDRTWHPISKEDKAAMTAMRAIVEPNKGAYRARQPEDRSTRL